jgi:hypothetical protein
MLSRGARLCEQIIRVSKARQGGIRQVGRPYLARRLGCSVRTVSRYTTELVEAGRLDRIPPRKVRRANGWRTIEVNRYRLTRTAHPAPHVQTHNRRSSRSDTHGTPPLAGSDYRGRPAPTWTPEPQATAQRCTDPTPYLEQIRLALARRT